MKIMVVNNGLDIEDKYRRKSKHCRRNFPNQSASKESKKEKINVRLS